MPERNPVRSGNCPTIVDNADYGKQEKKRKCDLVRKEPCQKNRQNGSGGDGKRQAEQNLLGRRTAAHAEHIAGQAQEISGRKKKQCERKGRERGLHQIGDRKVLHLEFPDVLRFTSQDLVRTFPNDQTRGIIRGFQIVTDPAIRTGGMKHHIAGLSVFWPGLMLACFLACAIYILTLSACS